MSPQPIPTTDCPQHFQLLALVDGTLTDEDTLALENHVAACDVCDGQLASIEEESDALIRVLAGLPATPEDETTFRILQADLLARPEPFRGNRNTVLSSQIPLDLVLPLPLGNYELLEQIGAGAHGAVFRARHRRLERQVAVKLLLHAGGPAVEDFLNEMRVVGQLDHPNIIRATDAGQHGGTYFLVMEFVPGLDVSSLLCQFGPLSVANACEISRQTALGIDVAHDHGLVHRDVKTSNLLFTMNGQVKLLDLGLATIASAASSQQAATKSGPRGTADYMAPEQWLEASTVTAKADIYSLGCTLFKLLTGVPPYRTFPDGITSKQQAHALAAVPNITLFRDDVPGPLAQLLNCMLAKSPSARPTSAMQVAESLERFARGNDLAAVAARVFPDTVVTASSTASKTAPWVSRRVMLAGAVIATAAALPMLWPNRKSSKLQSGQWRTLLPSNPPLLHVVDDDDSELDVQLE